MKTKFKLSFLTLLTCNSFVPMVSSLSSCNLNKCRIEFDSRGGTTISTIICQKGDIILAPTNPSKEGYDFVGWYTDETRTQKFDFSQKITNNIKLYARWLIKHTEDNLEKKLNDWTEQYQNEYLQNLTYSYHNYYIREKCVNLHCKSQAEAVAMWGYGPGYEVWNGMLHRGNGSTEELDNTKHDIFGYSFYAPDVDDPYNGGLPHLIEMGVWPGDYKYLDSALKLSTAHQMDGNNLKVWHGMEHNEKDIEDFLNAKLGVNIRTVTPSSIMADIPDPNTILKNQSYTNFGYCATSFNEQMAKGWAKGDNAKDFTVVPYLEINLDPDVYCAYISYSRQKYFDGFFLGWPGEYQLLVNRNMKLDITNAEWGDQFELYGKQRVLLKLTMSGHKQNI